MKYILALATSFSALFVNANTSVCLGHSLSSFYESLLCEEKAELAAFGLTQECSITPPSPTPPAPPSPPDNPTPPPFKTDFLPIVLVNNSGLPDSDVYILVTGDNVPDTSQVWGVVDTSEGVNFGVVTLQDISPGDNSISYSYALSSLPETTGGRVIYVPEMRSGIVWFSMNEKLNMPVNPNPPFAIVQPNFTDSSDPNYTTNFDIFEFTFLLSGSPQVAADATAVSFFSLPLYGYLPEATSVSGNTGLYYPRSTIMSSAATLLNSVPEKTQWNKLFLMNGSDVLRLVSTGKSMAASMFDSNYLDNDAAYGYSYIEDIWTGSGSFYRINPMHMTVTVTDPSTATYNYTGSVQSDNTFVFVSSDGGPTVTFPAPVRSPTPTGTTTYDIFSAINFITPTPTAGSAGDAVSKLMQEAIIAGLVPTTNTLSIDYLQANQANYYKVNPDLSGSGQGGGPWYDVYSKSLHSQGSIYTYGFDEPLWPQVLIGSDFTNDVTYLGITIGSIE